MFRHPKHPKVNRHTAGPEQRSFHGRWHHRHEMRHRHFMHHYKYFRFFRPVGLAFSLLILYLMFSWIGIKETGVIVGALIIAKEIAQFFFLLRLEKRIFKPMEKIKHGLDEVATGNYNVKVEYCQPNDLELLIYAFNDMTEKLYEGEKLQSAYEENRKALIANISHDLKTPVTAIQGYIEALLEGNVADESKTKYFKTIYNNATYLNKLIDDLFLFSKLDMQKLGLQYERVSIGKFMGDLMEEFQFNFSEENIQLHYLDTLSEDVAVKLDGKRMQQAFTNILTNAVQHGPESGLVLHVRLYRQENLIGIDIQDNGPGIPEDKLAYIFDRFYRIETERPKNIAGTGLGLAIAKELVEAHGGTIRAVSPGCQGTCFTILLPVYDQAAEEERCE
ncbi:signal transduction histidine kinase [Anaerospora hongkongensis]|uniref:histidine kinase n=1 Tax=Anaerospora hongkongensis TaxID=244830 RepID=A0A4R1PWS2_9FIRM|nr:HAMP domain-containing sensor histidine kinase [Anaerospora hongkongensis]TCL36917.1 signal transduction histidine kinase [Anaerospora hongkongensis]